MLFTVSAKASSFGGLSNIGSTKKNVFVSGSDQNARITLIICKNGDLMAGRLLIYYLTIDFVQ